MIYNYVKIAVKIKMWQLQELRNSKFCGYWNKLCMSNLMLAEICLVVILCWNQPRSFVVIFSP